MGKGFLERHGIVRHRFKKDLFCFFLPFFAIFIVALTFCGKYGQGYTDLWRVLWRAISHPASLTELPVYKILGLVLFVLGLTLMVVAQITLWKNYSGFVVIKKDHRLITHGVYRFVRNPIYLGVFIVFIGIPVYAASFYGVLAMVIQIPIFLYRIGMEEELLTEHFGEEYEAYKRKTRRLIPFLY